MIREEFLDAKENCKDKFNFIIYTNLLMSKKEIKTNKEKAKIISDYEYLFGYLGDLDEDDKVGFLTGNINEHDIKADRKMTSTNELKSDLFIWDEENFDDEERARREKEFIEKNEEKEIAEYLLSKETIEKNCDKVEFSKISNDRWMAAFLNINIGFYYLELGKKDKILERDIRNIMDLAKNYQIKRFFVYFRNVDNVELIDKIVKILKPVDIYAFKDITIFEMRNENTVYEVHEDDDLGYGVTKYFMDPPVMYCTLRYVDLECNFYDIYEYYQLVEENEELRENFYNIKGAYSMKKFVEDEGETEIKVINLKDVNGLCVDIDDLEVLKVTSDFKKIVTDKFKVRKYDIVYTLRGYNFKFAIILDDIEEDVVLLDSVGVFRFKNIQSEGINKILKTFSFLLTPALEKNIDSFSSGISRYSIEKLLIPSEPFDDKNANEFLKKLLIINEAKKIEREMPYFYDSTIEY